MTFQTPEQWLASQGGGQQAGAVMSPEAWLASQNTGALSEDKTNAPKPADPLGIAKYIGEDAWKNTIQSIPVLADMILGLPAQAYGLATEATSRAISAVTGEERTAGAERAARVKAKTLEDLGGFAAPAQTAARGLGATPETSAAGKGMEKLSEAIQSGASRLEELTSGVVLKEDAQMLADTIMVGLGFRGLGIAKGKAAAPSGSKFSNIDWKSVPKDELRSGKVSQETVDSIIGKYSKKTGDTITQQEILSAIDPITRGMKDAELNAEALAYDLMERGASKKEVEVVRKKNPLVGKKLDELMTRRDELRSGPLSEGVLQGEVLPPEVGMPEVPTALPGVLGSEPGGLGLPDGVGRPPSLKAPEGGAEPGGGLPPPEGGLPPSDVKLLHTFDPVRAARETVNLLQLNPEKAKTIGLVGGGALAGYTLSEEGDLLSALFGGAAAALAPKLLQKGGLQTVDRALGSLSTQMRNISSVIGDRVALDYESGLLRRAHAALEATDPWVRELVHLPKEAYNKLSAALLTGAKGGVEAVLREIGSPELARQFVAMRTTLDNLGKEMKSRGILKNWRENYYPRIVMDREGLLNTLGRDAKTALQQKLAEAQTRAIREGTTWGEVEVSNVINNFLKSPEGRAKVGFLKGRKIGEITEEMLPFYANPVESLHTYIRNAAKEISKADLFGKDLKVRDGKIDFETSLGELVAREVREGRLTPDQIPAIQQLLRDRFQGGERGGAEGIQVAKNLANIGLLADVISAGRQLADIGTIYYKYGVKPTLMAVVQGLRGKNPIRAADFGLMDHLAEEFVNQGTTARFLNKAFRVSGFSLADLSMKTLDINTSLIKNANLAKTPAGQIKLAERWSQKLGPEKTIQLLEDLKAGRLSDDVLTATFADLTRSQPVSMSELPPSYAANPNGRWLYMLKSWQLKQYDLIRNDMYKKIKQGHVKEGVTNLVRYAAGMTAAGVSVNTTIDWLLGKPIDLEAQVVENMMKTIGWSKYQTEKVSSGKPVEAVMGMAAPPFKMFDDVISRDPSAVRYMPVIGDLLYFHQFGGKEKAWERQRKSEAATKRQELQAMHPERAARIKALRQERAATRTRKYMEANQ